MNDSVELILEFQRADIDEKKSLLQESGKVRERLYSIVKELIDDQKLISAKATLYEITRAGWEKGFEDSFLDEIVRTPFGLTNWNSLRKLREAEPIHGTWVTCWKKSITLRNLLLEKYASIIERLKKNDPVHDYSSAGYISIIRAFETYDPEKGEPEKHFFHHVWMGIQDEIARNNEKGAAWRSLEKVNKIPSDVTSGDAPLVECMANEEGNEREFPIHGADVSEIFDKDEVHSFLERMLHKVSVEMPQCELLAINTLYDKDGTELHGHARDIDEAFERLGEIAADRLKLVLDKSP